MDEMYYSRDSEYYEAADYFYDEYKKAESDVESFIQSIKDSGMTPDEIAEDSRVYPLLSKVKYTRYAFFIFESMAVEAYINAFGAMWLGTGFFKEHLDNLDILSKCIVVTKLVTGVDFPKSTHLYERLKTMKEIRNKLVHSKVARFTEESTVDDFVNAFRHKGKEIEFHLVDLHGIYKELMVTIENIGKDLNTGNKEGE